MIQTLSENEMKLRMKEIKNERNKLKEEYDEYEMYFYNKKKKIERENQKKYIGKCFKLKPFENHDIKAFKVLDIDEEYNLGASAYCLSLIKTKNKIEISYKEVQIFTYKIPLMMNRESDPKVIDMYDEFSQEEFINLYNDYVKEIGRKVYAI